MVRIDTVLTRNVQENIVSTVKPTRPSQPPRWHMPSDISLKAALQKTKADRLGASGTLSGVTMGSTGGSTLSSTAGKRAGKVRPVFELYKDCETALNMSVQLHRYEKASLHRT
jgi:hypothetical protein